VIFEQYKKSKDMADDVDGSDVNRSTKKGILEKMADWTGGDWAGIPDRDKG